MIPRESKKYFKDENEVSYIFVAKIKSEEIKTRHAQKLVSNKKSTFLVLPSTVSQNSKSDSKRVLRVATLS